MIHIRRTLAAALLAAGSAIGFATVASAQQGGVVPPSGAHGQHRGRAHGPGRAGAQFLRGMTLNDAEKANLKGVRAKYAPQMKALRDQATPQLQALRDARQRGDTAALRSLRQQAQAQHAQKGGQAKQLMIAQQSDIRAALSPANQAKFDANVAQFQTRVANRRQNFGKKPHRVTGDGPRA